MNGQRQDGSQDRAADTPEQGKQTLDGQTSKAHEDAARERVENGGIK